MVAAKIMPLVSLFYMPAFGSPSLISAYPKDIYWSESTDSKGIKAKLVNRRLLKNFERNLSLRSLSSSI